METAQNRKNQIVDIASKLFRKKGYDATTMRDIAAEMHIEAASLYHHIKSKEELLSGICFDMADRFLQSIEEVNDIYFNAEEKLRMAISQHVRILTDNPDQSAVFQNEWRSLEEEKLMRFIDLRNQYEKGIRNIIRAGIDEDIFTPVDLKFASIAILSTANSINDWYSPGGEMTPEQVAHKLCDFVIGGLRKKWVTDPDYKP